MGGWLDEFKHGDIKKKVMKLQSIRSLKKELLSEGLTRHVVAASALPVAARAFRSVAGSEPPAAVRPSIPVALGIRGRGANYRLAVRVQHAMPGMNAVLQRIFRRAHGEMDLRVVGRVFKQAPWHRKRNRPLRIGGSIGHIDITAGTLGCFVVSRSGSGDDLMLSNNHVLADENNASRGDRVVQPGEADGGKGSTDVVGHLHKFIRLKKRNNAVDAATASIADEIEYYYDWLHSRGPITGIRDEPLDEGDIVYKVGRTTGLRKGRVSAIEVDSLLVEYQSGDLEFDGQIEIEPVGSKPFSLGGDSGSLIFDSRRRAVAILFAGNDSDATYASPIRTVLDALRVDLVY